MITPLLVDGRNEKEKKIFKLMQDKKKERKTTKNLVRQTLCFVEWKRMKRFEYIWYVSHASDRNF